MAILQTEGLVKVNRGYYQTAKLVEVHKVTDGFAAFACRAAQKNEPPPPKKPETEEVGGRYIYFEGGKDGTNGKTLDKNSSEPIEQHTTEGRGFNSEEFKTVKPDKTQLVQPDYSEKMSRYGAEGYQEYNYNRTTDRHYLRKEKNVC